MLRQHVPDVYTAFSSNSKVTRSEADEDWFDEARAALFAESVDTDEPGRE